jgi:hypothetical protein
VPPLQEVRWRRVVSSVAQEVCVVEHPAVLQATAMGEVPVGAAAAA